MKKLSKVLSIVLVAVMFISIAIGNTPITANAQNANQQIKETVDTEAQRVKNALAMIEAKFLIQNLDGTTSIDSEANKYIDSDLMKQITTGAEQINNLIRSGDLIFDSKTRKLNEKPHVKPCTAIYGEYIWHWYGFDFCMDAFNANLFGAKLAQWAAVLVGGSIVGSVIPGVSFVCGAGAATLAYWSAIAWEGAGNGRGCIAYFYGDPSWAQLYSVQLR